MTETFFFISKSKKFKHYVDTSKCQDVSEEENCIEKNIWFEILGGFFVTSLQHQCSLSPQTVLTVLWTSISHHLAIIWTRCSLPQHWVWVSNRMIWQICSKLQQEAQAEHCPLNISGEKNLPFWLEPYQLLQFNIYEYPKYIFLSSIFSSGISG